MSERIKAIQATPKSRRAPITWVKDRRRNRTITSVRRVVSSIRLVNKRPPVHTVRENNKKVRARKESAKRMGGGESVCVICFSAWENIERHAPSLDAARKTRNVTFNTHYKMYVLIASLSLIRD